MVSVSPEVLDDIEKGRLPAGERRTLSSEGFLVRSPQTEERQMRTYLDELNSGNNAFCALVVLNLDCNLGCKYCFEGTRKGKHYLSVETAKQFTAFVRSRDLEDKDEINITFYGGEPLLSTDMIVRVAEEMRGLAEERNMEFTFSLITNGTLLTRRIVEKLKPLGLAGAGVTLDGPREVHDLFRPFKSGTGSFDTIVGNLRDVCGLIDVQVGGNYTREHYRVFPRLLDHFLDTGLTPEKISFVSFGPVINERGEFSPPDFHDGCMSSEEPWLIDAGTFLREEILKRGFRTRKVGPAICMMAIHENIVVNFDGTLYKCPGMIGREHCSVGDLRNGLADYRRSHALDDWKNEKCLSCCYLPLCFGGCKYMKLIHDGSMQGIDCRKHYFDKALQSLVLQDVKYDNADKS